MRFWSEEFLAPFGLAWLGGCGVYWAYLKIKGEKEWEKTMLRKEVFFEALDRYHWGGHGACGKDIFDYIEDVERERGLNNVMKRFTRENRKRTDHPYSVKLYGKDVIS